MPDEQIEVVEDEVIDSEAAIEEVDEDKLFAEMAENREAPDDGAESDDLDDQLAAEEERLASEQEAGDEAGKIEAEAAKKDDEVDPLEGMTDKQKENYQSLEKQLGDSQGEVGKLNHRIDSDQGRVAAFQKQAHEAKTALENTGNEGKVSEDELTKALASDENWGEFTEEHPELAKSIEGMMRTQQDSTDKKINDAIAPFVADHNEKATEEAYGQIEEEYPDWVKSVYSGEKDDQGNDLYTKDYADWIQTQPVQIRALGESDVVQDATSLMSLYDDHRIAVGLDSMKQKTDLDDIKSDVNKSDLTNERREQQLEDGSAVPSKSAGVKESADNLSSEDAIWNAFANKRERNRQRA